MQAWGFRLETCPRFCTGLLNFYMLLCEVSSVGTADPSHMCAAPPMAADTQPSAFRAFLCQPRPPVVTFPEELTGKTNPLSIFPPPHGHGAGDLPLVAPA